MSSPRTYSSYSISSMNSTNLWSNSIKKPDTYVKKNAWDSEPLYNLHPTGDCDLDGRKYIALPADLKITKEANLKLLFPNYKAGLKNLLS